ncbi:MAG: mechanosensitive ion channel family protein [bacterium]|nr:mechanosensitive ion channel family protein [bacterium]
MYIIIPLIYIIAGLFIGLIFERAVINSLKKTAIARKWKPGEVLLSSLKNMFPVWFLCLGIYLALSRMPELLSPDISWKVLVSIILFTLTLVLARIAVNLVMTSTNKVKGVLPSTSIFTNMTRFLIILIGLLIILQFLGISITPILTALGVGGLAVALALQSTLINLFSGLQMLASGKIKPGDYIKLDSGEEGYVTDIAWRSTTIKALPNNIVIVPNSKIASATITNYHMPDKEIAVLLDVGVSYNSDLEKVEKVTVETGRKILKQIPGGVAGFDPFIRFHTFGDHSINFSVILRVREYVDQYLVKHEFIKELFNAYKKENIEIPFPVRKILIEEKK